MLVLGGQGFFGRAVVDDLLAHSAAEIAVAGRRPVSHWPGEARVRVLTCDQHDPDSLERALGGAAVAVHCAGPYQGLDAGPLRAALAARVHWIDLGDDRGWVRQASSFAGEAARNGVALLPGLSVVPGLSALVTRAFARDLERVESVRTIIAPSARPARGRATLASLLSGAGSAFSVLRAGHEVRVRGWTEPEVFEFPPPIGRRIARLALETADQDVLREVFGVRRAEFKAGSDRPRLDAALALAARLRARFGWPRLERHAGLARALLALHGSKASDAAAALFELTGTAGPEIIERRIAIVACERGERIPAVAASIAAARILDGRLRASGLVSHQAWIDAREFFDELALRGLELWKAEGRGPWERLRG